MRSGGWSLGERSTRILEVTKYRVKTTLVGSPLSTNRWHKQFHIVVRPERGDSYSMESLISLSSAAFIAAAVPVKFIRVLRPSFDIEFQCQMIKWLAFDLSES